MRQPLPHFSIVIPTYARPVRLAACLGSLVNLDFPRDGFDVIVVDDGSPVPLDSVIAPFRDQLNIALLTQTHAGPAAARNHGAAQARGTVLAFTDDDCLPTPGWLRALADSLAAAPTAAVGGRTLNALTNNPYATASQLLVDYLYAYYNAQPNQAQFFTSNNLALPADLFQALGGFDTSFPLAAGEDRDFCDRWRHAGQKMIASPDAVVYHAHALTFRRFWRQHLHYGRGAWRFHQRRAQRGQGRPRVEPITFYRDLILSPFWLTPDRRAPLLAGLLAVSQLANAIGFVQEWRSGGSEG